MRVERSVWDDDRLPWLVLSAWTGDVECAHLEHDVAVQCARDHAERKARAMVGRW